MVAVTEKLPDVLLAINPGVVRRPCGLVVPVNVEAPPAKVADGPVDGRVNVTEALGTPLPLTSNTRATSALNVWPVPPNCLEPETALMPTEATRLVRLKLALRLRLAPHYCEDSWRARHIPLADL